MKTGVDVKKLRERTDRVIKQNEHDQRVMAEQATNEAALKKEEEENKAQEIIGDIGRRCLTEAMAGRNHAIIMNAVYNRPKRLIVEDAFVTYQHCDPAWLDDVSKMVWDACVEDGLRPTLEYWCRQVGNEDYAEGFNIVVHW